MSYLERGARRISGNATRPASIQTRLVVASGQHFLYDYYHPMLLGMILERATGTWVAITRKRKSGSRSAWLKVIYQAASNLTLEP